MGLEKQISEAKSRLKDWWQDPATLGRPIILGNRNITKSSKNTFDYFRYPKMVIDMLGNDKLKPLLRRAQDSPYTDISSLPKAPTGWNINFNNPRLTYIKEIMNEVPNQIAAFAHGSPIAEQIPIIRSQAGAGFPACCVGQFSSIPTTGPNTIWYETVRSWQELENLELDKSSPWWQLTMEITRKQLELSPNHIAVGFPSMNGTLDMLQTLRGTQNLMRDMLKEKDLVQRSLDRLSDIFGEVVNLFWDEIRKSREGSGSFIDLWAPGKTPSVQCDALAYIGPKQFERFALPYIKTDLENADYGTYHLDGPGAIKFLTELLEIPELDLIQWVHGAGEPDGAASKWYPLVKKVLKANKRIILYTSVDRVPYLMRKINRDGLDQCKIVFSIGNVLDFEVEQFLPWLFAENKWYTHDYWEEYDEILGDDPERYTDLMSKPEQLDLDYKRFRGDIND